MSLPSRDPADLAMDRYAGGDEDAFGELYDLLAPRLYDWLRRQTGAASRAEDLLQQTLLHMHRARGHFRRGAAVTPWAFAIARRLLIDVARKGKFESLGEPSPDVAGHVEPADEVLHARRLANRAENVLRGLPESQRTAFELVRNQGMSIAQAAEILGTTGTAVKLRVFRASEALRAALEEDGGGER